MTRPLRVVFRHLLEAILIASVVVPVVRGQEPATPRVETAPADAVGFTATADAPLTVDLRTGEGVLKDNARLFAPPWILTADEIRVNYKTREATARGHVVVTRPGLRILADSAVYREATRELELLDFRFGRPPVHIAGRRAHGTADVMHFENVTIIYGEPDRLAPRATASRVTVYREEERMEAQMVRAGFGVIPLVALTGVSRPLSFPTLEWESRAGLDSTVGLHVGASAYVPISDGFRPGATLDLYSKRGVLVGPGLRYGADRQTWFADGATDFAWIRDGGDRGEDLFGRPIDQDRHFWTWRHQSHGLDRRWSINGVLARWSDSAVVRDLRDDLFHRDQEPDTFLEASLNGSHTILSAFARAQLNEFQRAVERMPEVRLDLLPVPLGRTGIVMEAQAGAVALTEEFPGTDFSWATDRLDAYLGLSRTFATRSSLSLTPVAGARLSHYTRTFDDSGDYTRVLGEFGFDAGLRAWSVRHFKKPFLGFDSVRHIVRPTVQYRYVPQADKGSASIIPIDRGAFLTRLQPLGLADRRDIDLLGEIDVVRFGLANVVEARREDYGSTRLFELNLAADLHLDDSHSGERLSHLQTELRLTPARWLDTWIFLRNDLETLDLRELNLRVMVVDSTAWSLGLDANTLSGAIGELRLFGRIALDEANEIYGRIVYDTRESRFNEIRAGLSRRVTQHWQFGLGATLRDGQQRGSDFGLKAEVRFLAF